MTAVRPAVVAMPVGQARAELLTVAMTAAAAFQARGFQWASRGSSHVPDVGEIVESLTDRLKSMVESGGTHGSSSGRLWVTPPGEEGQVEIWLHIGTLEGFIAVEECDACTGTGYTDLSGDEACAVCEGVKTIPSRAAAPTEVRS